MPCAGFPSLSLHRTSSKSAGAKQESYHDDGPEAISFKICPNLPCPGLRIDCFIAFQPPLKTATKRGEQPAAGQAISDHGSEFLSVLSPNPAFCPPLDGVSCTEMPSSLSLFQDLVIAWVNTCVDGQVDIIFCYDIVLGWKKAHDHSRYQGVVQARSEVGGPEQIHP